MGDYPCALIEDKINNKNVTIMGVVHSYPFLREHHALLKSKIGKADTFVLEQVVGAEFYQSKDFFGPVGNMAIPKPVYVIDPVNKEVFYADMFQSALGILIMTNPLFKYLSDQMIEKQRVHIRKKLKLEEKPKEPATRRDFLKSVFKTTAQVGIGASLLGGSFVTFGIKGIFSENLIMKYDLEDALTIGMLDFRNLMIGEGLDKLTKLGHDNVLLIHGDAHSDPIHYYATHKGARKKRLLYYPYELIGKKGIRKFVYNNRKWNIEEIISF